MSKFTKCVDVSTKRSKEWTCVICDRKYQYEVYDNLFKGEFKLDVLDLTMNMCQSVSKFEIEEGTDRVDSVLTFEYRNGHRKKESVCVDTEQKCNNNPRIRTKSANPELQPEKAFETLQDLKYCLFGNHGQYTCPPGRYDARKLDLSLIHI